MILQSILVILSPLFIIIAFILQFFLFKEIENQFKGIRTGYGVLPRALRFTPMEIYSGALKTKQKKLKILAIIYVSCFIIYVLSALIYVATNNVN